MNNLSCDVPDWSRESKSFFAWTPSRSLLASIRAYLKNSESRSPINIFLRKFAVLRHRFWSIVTGADIPINCKIGGGLLLPHPNGIVIHSGGIIGPNCLIFQQVTIGSRGDGGLPVIGGNVDIGAGARILGGLIIGCHSRIGANSVVLRDVPDNAVAVGVPASIVIKSGLK